MHNLNEPFESDRKVKNFKVREIKCSHKYLQYLWIILSQFLALKLSGIGNMQ
jgi:hypothetical protein